MNAAGSVGEVYTHRTLFCMQKQMGGFYFIGLRVSMKYFLFAMRRAG
jgi:hypothetical protein